VESVRRRNYGKYILRWLIALVLLVAVISTAFVGCTRLLHIFLTSQGLQQADVPSEEEYPVRGVDLSYYQGNIDWDVLAEQNVTFAFIKATEGVDHNDTQFSQTWESAKDSSVYVGAYHFYRFEDSGAEQAENFIQTVPVTENTLPPVIDVELYASLEETDLPDVEETQENLREMLELLEEHYGVKPILYAAPNTYRKYVKVFQGDYPIWLSNYYYEPYSDWTFWQYTDDGELDGYDGYQQRIDLNVYKGSLEEFMEQFHLVRKRETQ
jgi:lysozyme